jgi:hypothetical protein
MVITRKKTPFSKVSFKKVKRSCPRPERLTVRKKIPGGALNKSKMLSDGILRSLNATSF